MRVIDISTSFGLDPTTRNEPRLENLLTEMDRNGVAGALTSSRCGMLYVDRNGNRETLEATRRNPRLAPVGVIYPVRYFDWEEEIEYCLANRFAALRFFPIPYWPYASMADMVRSVAFRRIVARLRGTGLPLIVTARAGGDITALADATAEAGLPVVVAGAGYATVAELLHAMQLFPHLYCETSDARYGEAIETLVGEVGAERVLFGSGWPQRSPRMPLNTILYAAITPAEREAILGGNAARLFKLDAERLPVPAEPPAGRVPYDGPIYDVHGHMGDWRLAVRTHDVRGMTAVMDRLNIRYLNVSSSYALNYDMQAGNRELYEAMQGQDRVRGYVYVNAHYLAKSCAEMDTYYPAPHFVGAKIHTAYAETPTESPEMAALFRELAKRGKPVKIDVTYGGPRWEEALQGYARQYPELPIIRAHGFGLAEAQRVAGIPNLYTEMISGRTAREIEDTVGIGRMLFGSDMDLLDPAWMLATFWEAGFSAEQLRAIMWDNSVRLFGA